MPGWQTRLTEDRSELLAFLNEDRPYAALAIGDLEQRFFAESTFAVAEADGRIGAMALHFRGITPSPLQLMGDNGGLRAIVDEQPCPGTAYVVARPEHVPVVEEFYDWDRSELMWRMTMRSEDFRGGTGGCVRLCNDLRPGQSDGPLCLRRSQLVHPRAHGAPRLLRGLRRRAGRRGRRNPPGQPDLRRRGRRERIHDAAWSRARLRHGRDERRRSRPRTAGHPGHRPGGRPGQRERDPHLRAPRFPAPLSHRRRTSPPSSPVRRSWSTAATRRRRRDADLSGDAVPAQGGDATPRPGASGARPPRHRAGSAARTSSSSLKACFGAFSRCSLQPSTPAAEPCTPCS